METKQKLGIAGSLMLIFGVFAPVMNIPFFGSVAYIKGDGSIVLVMGIIALALSWFKRYVWLAIPSIISIGLMAYSIIKFHIAISDMKEKLSKNLEGNPFSGLGDLAMQTVKLEWGWDVLILGAIIVGLTSIPFKIPLKKK